MTLLSEVRTDPKMAMNAALGTASTGELKLLFQGRASVLLLPADERSTSFFVGSREFDPAKVGFETVQAEGTTLFDTSKPGNSNAGHDMYGEFSEEERWQLVEYLKSL